MNLVKFIVENQSSFELKELNDPMTKKFTKNIILAHESILTNTQSALQKIRINQ